jgi:hypothetical protein
MTSGVRPHQAYQSSHLYRSTCPRPAETRKDDHKAPEHATATALGTVIWLASVIAEAPALPYPPRLLPNQIVRHHGLGKFSERPELVVFRFFSPSVST